MKSSWQTVFIESFKAPHSYCIEITHVLPIVDYCDVVWVPTNVSHLKRLEIFRLHSHFLSFEFCVQFYLS